MSLSKLRTHNIVVPPVLVKSRAPHPLRMTVVKADLVDGSFVVSLRIHFLFYFCFVYGLTGLQYSQAHDPLCQRCVDHELNCTSPPGQSCSECRRNKASCPFTAPVSRGAPKTKVLAKAAESSKRTCHGRTKKSLLVVKDSDEDQAPPPSKRKCGSKADAKGKHKAPVGKPSGIDLPWAIRMVQLLRQQVANQSGALLEMTLAISRLGDILGHH
jgi:hypothetical protein